VVVLLHGGMGPLTPVARAGRGLRLAGALGAAGLTLLRAGDAEPVAIYHFDEGNGAVVHDSSPNHNDGQVVGGATWAPKGVAGTALLFDGRSRVRIPSAAKLDLTGPHTISAWIRGRSSPLHFVDSYPNFEGMYFQVCGDTVFLATWSTPYVDPGKYSLPPLRADDAPHIYTGTIDVSLENWELSRRTAAPLSGFEPKMQVVGDRIYYEYTGRDAKRVEQIWTTESARNGSGYHATQRTANNPSLVALPSDPDQIDTKQVGDTIYRVDHGAVAVAGGRLYIAYPAQDKDNIWQFTTAICDGERTETRTRTSDRGWIPSGIQIAGDQVFYLFPKGNDVFESYTHAQIPGANRGIKTAEGIYVAASDRDGGNWRIIRRVGGPSPTSNIASFVVSNGRIYVIWSQLDPDGSGHSVIYTGAMDLDGSHFEKWQRTFAKGLGGTSISSGVQAAGRKLYYVFDQLETDLSFAELGSRNGKSPAPEWSVWIAECNLDGSDWKAQPARSGPSSMEVGYKGLAICGAKRYFGPIRLTHSAGLKGMMGSDGANIVNKGDAYGLGVTGAGEPRGFVNAGQDYLFRGDGPADTAGATADAAEPIGDGSWYHLAEVYDENRVSLYVNGELKATAPYSAPPASNPFPLTIGDGFVGCVDEVLVYDRPLSGGEVRQLFRQYR
jgi:hypothetical protein